MASPPTDPSSSTSPSYRSLLESTPLWQALDRLVDRELSKDGILALSRLGAADAGKVFDVFEHEGRSGVDKLLSLLEGVPGGTLGSLIDAVANEKNERGRPRSRNTPRSSIDNNIHASTATPLATPYLRPPYPSLRRSSSTRTRSASSSSTNITHPSAQKRVKLAPKSTRKQLYCPDCGKEIKNGFDKHFDKQHIPHLLDGEISGRHVIGIGCGYCPAHDLLADHGKVFRGVDNFLHHVKDVHASTPQRLHWDFNSSFNHILSAQSLFRRKILYMIEQDRQKSANQSSQSSRNNTHLTLSWVPSPLTRHLLGELQVFTGNIESDPSLYADHVLDDLLARVYEAASHKWQPLSALSTFAVLPQRAPRVITQEHVSQPPSQNSSQDAMSFAGIGQAFDTPPPKYPSFAIDARSPSILSPSPQAPQHIQRTYQSPEDAEMERQITVPLYVDSSLPDAPPSTFAFDGHAPYSTATPPPSHGLHLESMQYIYKDFDINQSDFFNT